MTQMRVIRARPNVVAFPYVFISLGKRKCPLLMSTLDKSKLVALENNNNNCKGKTPKSNNGPWAPYRVQPRPRRKWGTKKNSSPTLISPSLFKKTSEEECLLRRTKYGPNVHPIHNEESLQTNISSKDERHKARRRKRI